MQSLQNHTQGKIKEKPYVAVATMEGMLVNKHLGEAEKFQIWGKEENGRAVLIEERWAPDPGTGHTRWEEMARILHDCRAVLVSAFGPTPQAVLEKHDIMPIAMEGFIEQGVETIYSTGNLSSLCKRSTRACTAECPGSGEGC